MPRLSIVLMPLVLKLRVIQRLSLGSQYRFRWTFGSHRRLVRRWEWETFLPKPGLRPVTSQTFGIGGSSGYSGLGVPVGTAPTG